MDCLLLYEPVFYSRGLLEASFWVPCHLRLDRQQPKKGPFRSCHQNSQILSAGKFVCLLLLMSSSSRQRLFCLPWFAPVNGSSPPQQFWCFTSMRFHEFPALYRELDQISLQTLPIPLFLMFATLGTLISQKDGIKPILDYKKSGRKTYQDTVAHREISRLQPVPFDLAEDTERIPGWRVCVRQSPN